jgi:hypothetical protein
MRRAMSLAFAFGLAWPSAALACPDCDASRAARSAVLGDPSLLGRLALMVLPIALIGAVAAMLYRVGDARSETSGGEP